MAISCYICEKEFQGADKVVNFLMVSYHAEIKMTKENYDEVHRMHVNNFHENGKFLMDDTKNFHPQCLVTLLKHLPLKFPEDKPDDNMPVL